MRRAVIGRAAEDPVAPAVWDVAEQAQGCPESLWSRSLLNLDKVTDDQQPKWTIASRAKRVSYARRDERSRTLRERPRLVPDRYLDLAAKYEVSMLPIRVTVIERLATY
jgi:hypothetical protein